MTLSFSVILQSIILTLGSVTVDSNASYNDKRLLLYVQTASKGHQAFGMQE